MTHGSLFSGIGGFDLAAEWAGFTNLFNCEWEEFPRKVLKHHFPNAEQYEDIHDFDATKYNGRIDILSGGFPCQPFSVAGKRLGKEDERHLWPEMLRVIRECSPRWVVGENVRGLVSWSDGLVFQEVCADLEALGYSVQSFIIPACATGAPHRRDRVWIVAHAQSNGNKRNMGATQKKGEKPKRKESRGKFERNSERNAPDPEHNGQPATKRRGSNAKTSARSKKGQKITKQFEGVHESEKLGSLHAPDTNDEGLQGCEERRGFGGSREKRNKQPPGRIRREWENFPTVPPVCGGDDGLPKELDGITFSKWRKESIKAYGNAIVPQVADRIFKSINDYENDTN